MDHDENDIWEKHLRQALEGANETRRKQRSRQKANQRLAITLPFTPPFAELFPGACRKGRRLRCDETTSGESRDVTGGNQICSGVVQSARGRVAGVKKCKRNGNKYEVINMDEIIQRGVLFSAQYMKDAQDRRPTLNIRTYLRGPAPPRLIFLLSIASFTATCRQERWMMGDA